jgi:hypothetical protein
LNFLKPVIFGIYAIVSGTRDMTYQEFVDELKRLIREKKINVVVRHPNGNEPLVLPANSIVRRSGEVTDIHIDGADPGNPNRE